VSNITRLNLQLQNSDQEIPASPEELVIQRFILQEDHWQDVAWRSVATSTALQHWRRHHAIHQCTT